MRIALNSTGVYKRKSYARNLCLARGLVKLGCEVTFLTCSDGLQRREFDDQGVHVVAFPEFLPYRLRKGGLGMLDTLSRVVYLFRKQFDLVHVDVGFRPAGGLPGHLYQRFRDVPYVCDWWDWIGKGGGLDSRSPLYQRTLGAWDNYFEVWDKRHADGVVTISKCLYDRAVSCGIPADRVTTIHGGADFDQQLDTLDQAEVRRRIGIPSDTILVGYSGMGPFEGMDLVPFFDAFATLKTRFPTLKWFSSGDGLPEKIVGTYAVEKDHINIGWSSYETYKLYLRAADILLLPQRKHLKNIARWPNKLGDYLAAGRPIVATDVGEVGQFMSLYPGALEKVEWNSSSIADVVTRILENPVASAERGQRNQKIARDEYSWDKQAERFFEFYKKISSLSGK